MKGKKKERKKKREKRRTLQKKVKKRGWGEGDKKWRREREREEKEEKKTGGLFMDFKVPSTAQDHIRTRGGEETAKEERGEWEEAEGWGEEDKVKDEKKREEKAEQKGIKERKRYFFEMITIDSSRTGLVVMVTSQRVSPADAASHCDVHLRRAMSIPWFTSIQEEVVHEEVQLPFALLKNTLSLSYVCHIFSHGPSSYLQCEVWWFLSIKNIVGKGR